MLLSKYYLLKLFFTVPYLDISDGGEEELLGLGWDKPKLPWPCRSCNKSKNQVTMTQGSILHDPVTSDILLYTVTKDRYILKEMTLKQLTIMFLSCTCKQTILNNYFHWKLDFYSFKGAEGNVYNVGHLPLPTCSFSISFLFFFLSCCNEWMGLYRRG